MKQHANADFRKKNCRMPPFNPALKDPACSRRPIRHSIHSVTCSLSGFVLWAIRSYSLRYIRSFGDPITPFVGSRVLKQFRHVPHADTFFLQDFPLFFSYFYAMLILNHDLIFRVDASLRFGQTGESLPGMPNRSIRKTRTCEHRKPNDRNHTGISKNVCREPVVTAFDPNRNPEANVGGICGRSDPNTIRKEAEPS